MKIATHHDIILWQKKKSCQLFEMGFKTNSWSYTIIISLQD